MIHSFEQPEQREQREQSEQSEQYEQSEQCEQFLRLSSAACAASLLPQRSTEHRLPLASVIQVGMRRLRLGGEHTSLVQIVNTRLV